MKTPEELTADIERRLTKTWRRHLANGEPAFPHTFPIGSTSAEQLRTAYKDVHQQIVAWQRWSHDHHVELNYVTRMAAGGTKQHIPTHIRIDSIDQAAMIVGTPWTKRLTRGRERLRMLHEQFPKLGELDQALQLFDDYSDLDFTITLETATYLDAQGANAASLTPRQIAVPGIHAKWLQKHLSGVQFLRGRDFDLLPRHASRIHFTYLDPRYRADGNRIHDSATIGDHMTPAYLPRIVVISENKDTAIWFPQLTAAISVEGGGRGGTTAATFDWLRHAQHVIYWGDMDADGLEILNGYRVAFDRDIDSILMTPDSYKEFEPFGTNLDKNNQSLTERSARPVPRLRSEERALYEMLIDPRHRKHRRIEQERIPLERALAEVRRITRVK